MRTLTLIVTVVLAFAAATGSESLPDLGVPQPLRAYRTWAPLLTEPRVVSIQDSALCDVPTRAETIAKTGPHGGRLIMVYGTLAGSMSLAGAKPLPLGTRPFPLGTVIAKEKLHQKNGPATGVAFMVKRSTPRFYETGGWEFLYYPAPLDAVDARRTHSSAQRVIASRPRVTT